MIVRLDNRLFEILDEMGAHVDREMFMAAYAQRTKSPEMPAYASVMRMPSCSWTSSTASRMARLTSSIFSILPAWTPSTGFETTQATSSVPSAPFEPTATTTDEEPKSTATV